jgi:predicted permease
MNPFRTIWLKLRSLGKRGAIKHEIDEELRFHIEQCTAKNIADGMTPEEAARKARKRFGNMLRVREECRDTKGVSFFEATWKDIRFGVRMLRRNPGFAIIAVLTLGLGIGATSAVFSLIQGVLLTPPPYPKPDQIAFIQPSRLDGKPYAGNCTTSQWLEWRQATNSFQAIAGYEWGFQYLVRDHGSEFVQGLFVTPDYFKVIGVKPLVGREFSNADVAARGGEEKTIILGYDLWRRQFNGDTNILGKVVRLSRYPPLTVIGVMPPGVRCLPSSVNASEPSYDVNAPVDFWIPLWPPNLTHREAGYCNMAGRLHDGVTLVRAQAELGLMASRQTKGDPDSQGITSSVIPLMEDWSRDGRRILLPLMGAVTLVFLIACANIAGLLLTRGLQRQQEYLVRCALGAGRAQLFRQVMTEGMLISLSGGGLGLGLAAGIVQSLKAIGGHAIPRLDTVAIGWPVLIFCLGSAFAAAIMAGLAPAMHAIGSNAAQSLKGALTSSLSLAERRILGGVAIVQIALTLALLVGAGLLIRTMANLSNIHTGYSTENILTMDVTSPAPTRMYETDAEALRRIAAIPGVKNVSLAWGVPLTGNHWMNQLRIEGQSDTDTGTGRDFKDEVATATRSVTADYFNTMNIALLDGRGFRSSDGWYGPGADTNATFVAVINQAMAKKYLGGRNPIGRKIRFNPGIGKSAEIIGVVMDSRDGSLAQNPEPEVYFYHFQLGAFTKALVVRTAADPRQLNGEVQRALRAIDPTIAIRHVKTMDQIRVESVASQFFAMRLLVAFSVVGSVLALVGIYGVLSLSVGSRKREIAIRMAVGAQRRNVLGLVLSEGLKLIVIGLVIGTGIALAFARVLGTFLFDVQPTDPIILVSAVLLFAAIALLACYIPARRAMRIEPMNALRHE